MSKKILVRFLGRNQLIGAVSWEEYAILTIRYSSPPVILGIVEGIKDAGIYPKYRIRLIGENKWWQDLGQNRSISGYISPLSKLREKLALDIARKYVKIVNNDPSEYLNATQHLIDGFKLGEEDLNVNQFYWEARMGKRWRGFGVSEDG